MSNKSKLILVKLQKLLKSVNNTKVFWKLPVSYKFFYFYHKIDVNCWVIQNKNLYDYFFFHWINLLFDTVYNVSNPYPYTLECLIDFPLVNYFFDFFPPRTFLFQPDLLLLVPPCLLIIEKSFQPRQTFSAIYLLLLFCDLATGMGCLYCVSFCLFVQCIPICFVS